MKKIVSLLALLLTLSIPTTMSFADKDKLTTKESISTEITTIQPRDYLDGKLDFTNGKKGWEVTLNLTIQGQNVAIYTHEDILAELKTIDPNDKFGWSHAHASAFASKQNAYYEGDDLYIPLENMIWQALATYKYDTKTQTVTIVTKENEKITIKGDTLTKNKKQVKLPQAIVSKNNTCFVNSKSILTILEQMNYAFFEYDYKEYWDNTPMTFISAIPKDSTALIGEDAINKVIPNFTQKLITAYEHPDYTNMRQFTKSVEISKGLKDLTGIRIAKDNGEDGLFELNFHDRRYVGHIFGVYDDGSVKFIRSGWGLMDIARHGLAYATLKGGPAYHKLDQIKYFAITDGLAGATVLIENPFRNYDKVKSKNSTPAKNYSILPIRSNYNADNAYYQ